MSLEKYTKKLLKNPKPIYIQKVIYYGGNAEYMLANKDLLNVLNELLQKTKKWREKISSIGLELTNEICEALDFSEISLTDQIDNSDISNIIKSKINIDFVIEIAKLKVYFDNSVELTSEKMSEVSILITLQILTRLALLANELRKQSDDYLDLHTHIKDLVKLYNSYLMFVPHVTELRKINNNWAIKDTFIQDFFKEFKNINGGDFKNIKGEKEASFFNREKKELNMLIFEYKSQTYAVYRNNVFLKTT